MFESLVPNIGDLNVQVPVSHVITVVAMIVGTWWAVSKAYALAKLLIVGVIARFSLAMIGSGALFLAGLAGIGNSTGSFLNSNDKVAPAYVEKSTIDSVLTSNGQTDTAKKMAFDYAKERDSRVAATQYISTKSEEVITPKEPNTTGSWTMLTTSIGMILVGLVWMIRRWDE